METLTIISDSNKEESDSYITRKASRAVVFDEDMNIALLYISKYGYHKLPGGGIDEGEDRKLALHRECMEEIGCTIKLGGEVGKIIEYRKEYKQKHISYCYIGTIISTGKASPTNKEVQEGAQIRWVSQNDVLSILAKDKPTNYVGKFIQKRDIIFIEKALSLKTFKI